MNSSKLALWLSWLIGLILVLLPFHAFLTVWSSSGLGHYTLLRLWPEFLLVPLLLGSLYCLASDPSLLKKLWALSLVRLIAAYSVLLLVCGGVAYASHYVGAKALWYGWLVDLRFLVFFLAVLVISAKSDWLKRYWQLLLLIPTALVSLFAILQHWILPYDFLKHFGYGDQTIPPYETINHNINHLRVASTLRGANPLGAYLLLPITTTTALVYKKRSNRLYYLVFSVVTLLALVFSFSRSAWLGAALSLGIVGWVLPKSERTKQILIWCAATVVLISAGLVLALRNNPTIQNTFWHTQANSNSEQSSNELHGLAFKAAAEDIVHQPLGGGVGTAGPQSVYNTKQLPRVAEDYYLQIGQEAGLIGLGLFIAICVAVGRQLWRRRKDPLALALVASLIGISLINLLSHAWSDATLAYLWWGLAGIAIGSTLLNNKLKLNN